MAVLVTIWFFVCCLVSLIFGFWMGYDAAIKDSFSPDNYFRARMAVIKKYKGIR